MSDHELAKRAQRGDSDAFAELAHRYQHQVYRVAYRFGGSADRADDLCQDCLLRAYCQIARYDSQRPFLPWLMRVTWNVCINAKAGDPRRREVDIEQVEPNLTIGREETENTVIAGLEKQRVLAALETLPADIRMLVVMRFVSGMSFREISEQTGVKLPTVAFRVSRGIDRLREALLEGPSVIEP